MNEQMEKLAELSGFKQDMLNIGIWYSPEFQKYAEKFGELIVKECADVATTVYFEPGRGMKHFSSRIKEHFGVEK